MSLKILNGWIFAKGKLELLEGFFLVAPPVPNPPSLPRSQSHPERIGSFGGGRRSTITPTCGNKTSKRIVVGKKDSKQGSFKKI